jgi:hypothetical protein
MCGRVRSKPVSKETYCRVKRDLLVSVKRDVI